jgi:hypothetical protein
MQRNLLTENFSSPTVRNHYYDSRAQAFAFLMTAGAKALILEEQKASKMISVEGINDEAQLRVHMVKEERIRSIRRKIMSKASLLVLKRGRDEKVRAVDVILHHDRKKGTHLSWKSKLNYVKKFEIPSTTVVSKVIIDELDNPPTSTRSSFLSTRSRKTSNASNDEDQSYINILKKKIKSSSASNSLIFLRLTNQSRSVDLSFRNQLELEAFVFILHKQVGLQLQADVVRLLSENSFRISSSTS